jgi:hypothetical protein
MPGISYAAAGALSGFVVQIYANSLRRIPALRRMPPRPARFAAPSLPFLPRLAPVSPVSVSQLRPPQLGGGSAEQPAYRPPKRRAVRCPACAGADRFNFKRALPPDPPARRCRAVERTGIHMCEWQPPAKGTRATRRVCMGGSSLAVAGPQCECREN